jgi:hypothetical protein
MFGLDIWGPSQVFLLSSQAEHSSPLVQCMKLIANRNSSGLQSADRGCNPAIGEVVARVVVEADD